jgi:hypothetical protein
VILGYYLYLLVADAFYNIFVKTTKMVYNPLNESLPKKGMLMKGKKKCIFSF